jgi:hypothetical protein
MPELDSKPDDKKKEKADLEQRMTNDKTEKYALAGGFLTALPAMATYVGNPYVQSLGYTISSALYMYPYAAIAAPLAVGAIVGGAVYYGIKKLLGYKHVKKEKKDDKKEGKKEPAAMPQLPPELMNQLQGMAPAPAPG